MAVRAIWDDDSKSILTVELAGNWTWNEATKTFTEVARMIRSAAPQPVCILLDFTRSSKVPVGALFHARRFTKELPENWEFTVMVGGGALVQSIWDVFFRLNPILGGRYRSARTLEEGRDLIMREYSRPAQV